MQSNTAISLLMIFKTSAGLELDFVLFFEFNFPALWPGLTYNAGFLDKNHLSFYYIVFSKRNYNSRHNGKGQETIFGQYFSRNLDTMIQLV